MTLAELLVAAAIASSSCCASLQVWGQAAQASHSARRLVQAEVLLERHWLASQRWLASEALACALDAEHLDQGLALALPLDAALQRSLHSDGDPAAVWLVLHHRQTGLERRQLLTAIGLGGCQLPEGSLQEPWS